MHIAHRFSFFRTESDSKWSNALPSYLAYAFLWMLLCAKLKFEHWNLDFIDLWGRSFLNFRWVKSNEGFFLKLKRRCKICQTLYIYAEYTDLFTVHSSSFYVLGYISTSQGSTVQIQTIWGKTGLYCKWMFPF